MNLTFFILLLSFLRSTGWCHALGSSDSGGCPEVSCSLARRESCTLGSNVCGNCLTGFFEVEGECISIESNPNDDSWESELEGTDGSDLNGLFGTTRAPTEKHSEQLEKSPISTHESSDFTTPSATATAAEESPNDLNNKNYDLGVKVGAENAESSGHQTEHESTKNKAKHIHSSNDFRAKSNDLKNKERDRSLQRKVLLKKKDENLQQKRKKLDEEKLNKFLSNKEENANAVSSDEDGVNLEGNSTTNPPPFIRKQKIGKGEDSKASEMDDIYFLFIVIGCSVAGIAGLGLAGYCWYKLHTTAKAVSESEYAGYGLKGSNKRAPSLRGDDKLDYNAEMYHYHQTKSQLAAMEKAGAKSSKQGSLEDDENSDEGDEGDYTVYECPGLAPTGDMTVVNPLFSDQEAVGSDQDANGNRSGHSSPTSSRHSTTTKSAE